MSKVIEEYIGKIYIVVILMVTGSATCAGVTFSVLKLLGLYPDVSPVALGIFVATCVIYFMIGLILIKKSYEIDQSGKKILKPGMLKIGKIFVTIIIFAHFNFISYMIPSREFWAYNFFFVILAALFLDVKMIIAVAMEILVSLVVSSIIKAKVILPVADDLFVPEMVLRIVGVFLSLGTIVLMVFLISHYLVNMKKNEIEQNNARVQYVLTTAQNLSEQLLSAGMALSEISTNESASAEELAATSETLLNNSNALSKKSDESISNLNELKQWGALVNENVEKVGHISKDILKKSQENEQCLNSLQTINDEVVKSMQDTNEVAQKLADAVKEIDVTLNLINDISASTNLLSLNAAIEAARAGEAGRGFAVVAQEVGQLANSTKDSLDEVQKVITKVQQNVSEMTGYVAENSHKLNKQNEYFVNVFQGIQEMIVLLHQSMADIETMNSAHDKQTEVIKNTVWINENIAESIQHENQEFTNISGMVENNATDIMQMTEQIAVINKMVEEIDDLLKA